MTIARLSRSVERIISSQHTIEGAGFKVRRPFPTRILTHMDPFMLLDEMGPMVTPPGEAVGAPDHPHRGFETVTYILDGELEHKDSMGNTGILGPQDVQWMTAGSGVVHSELPSDAFQDRGGRMHGFQLWVNLPAREKWIPPRYQDTPANRIPIATSDSGDVWVKVIAGEAMGESAVIETRTPILYTHFILQPGATITQAVPASFNAFAFVLDGEALIGDDLAHTHSGDMAILAHNGEAVSLRGTGEGPASILLIGGEPINEPVARYGPFVMNTTEEIYQAIEDYRAGRMGLITH
jgi:redox-sensitive bicupin YhaK (pirin superfamily)